MTLSIRSTSRRRFLKPWFVMLAGTASAFFVARPANAAVTATGQVAPAPPAGGGPLAGPFIVGDTMVGTLAIDGGTPLNLTSGSATVGNTVNGLGLVTLTGFGSNFSTTGTADLTIGSAGAGSVSVSNLAKITIGDDLFMGVIDGGSGNLMVSGFGSIVDVGDQILAGQSATGVIEVLAGGRLFADDTVIGQAATGDGRATVSGALSLWSQPNAMTVGDLGRGTLQVFNQGRMETLNAVLANGLGSFANVEVAGAGSVWEITGFFNLGVSGHSTMQIRDGGRITNTGAGRLATTDDSESHVEVSGANSLWAVGSTLTVGENGRGTLEILAGGRVTSTIVRLGDNAGARGDATVDGNGSTWKINGELNISDPAEATLTISNGALVTTTDVTRVNAAGTLNLDGGRLTVEHLAGTTNQGLIQGGGTITGAVTNTATGEIRVNAGDKLVLNNNLTNAGLVDVDFGELEVLGTATNTLDIDVRSSILRFQSGLSNNAGGGLGIVGGDVDVFGAITNAVNAQVVVGGESHTAFHDAFTNNGVLFITPGSELLTLENLGFGGGSSLNLELAGVDPDDGFGQVHVAGLATLAGALNVDLATGYVPAAGDSYQIITAAGGRSGVFSTEMLPPLPASLDWDVQYNPNSVVLAVVVLWRKGGPLQNEVATPGSATPQDYTEWRARFGNTSNPGSGSSISGGGSAVPEPSACILICVGCLSVFSRAARRCTACSATR
jgi:T5SS/PEP-CTERM-associated repeat protein